MKYLILILSLLLVLTAYAARLFSNFPEEENYEVLPPPFHHKKHEHEHEGLACCPCGGCHKYEDEEKELPEEITLWERLLSALLSVSVILVF